MTSDDAFMVLAGVRYCLGRHVHGAVLCCRWLRARWPEIDARDRTQIVHEIGKHIREMLEFGSFVESDLGLQTWRDFHAWAANCPTAPVGPDTRDGT